MSMFTVTWIKKQRVVFIITVPILLASCSSPLNSEVLLQPKTDFRRIVTNDPLYYYYNGFDEIQFY